jgi:hypothetical protein
LHPPSLTEIALSGAVLELVTRWITNARCIRVTDQRDGLTGAKSSPCRSRALFARGALRAALWARDQKPGYYTMADVLGL